MRIRYNIDPEANTLKYLQLVNAIMDDINQGFLVEGDLLPSVNELMKEAGLSRDTVFKAYSELKNRDVIESVPNKGYFVSRQMSRVLLFLDTFKAYKEVLYEGFRVNLPNNVSVDLHFHHYNIEVFKNIINDSIGKYSHYVVMNFDHPDVKTAIDNIPKEKLLIIDWNVNASKAHSFVCQDFGMALKNLLTANLSKIRKFDRFIYLYPEKMTFHPKTSIENFHAFGNENQLNTQLYYDPKFVDLQKGDLYLLVSDRNLAFILDKANEQGLEIGKDIGIISYNETPMKRFVKEGISVISTDFIEMGRLAADFVIKTHPVQHIIPTKLIERNSF